MSQEDVKTDLVLDLKAAAKVLLQGIDKVNGAADLEVEALTEKLGPVYGPMVAGLVKPLVHQLLGQLLAKVA